MICPYCDDQELSLESYAFHDAHDQLLLVVMVCPRCGYQEDAPRFADEPLLELGEWEPWLPETEQ